MLGTLGFGAALLGTAFPASAGVTAPFHGVTLVEGGSDALAIVDLCAAGVDVRATQYAERDGTPEQWATRAGVDAQIAVNADFFDFPGWTYVVGRARGAGQDWPANEQNRESRPYWEFGKFIATFQENGAAAPAAASLVTDIVGGHNLLIVGGKSRGPNFDGDPTITTSHRRTALGMSADHRFLYVYASDASLDGNQLVANLFARAASGGHPNGIDFATNQDGGGSSQMYVAGRGQIITSGRPVNNHLGIHARGAGAAANCPYAPPDGVLDSVACTGIAGWSQSPTAKTAAVDVHVYYGGPSGTPGVQALATTAGIDRKDLCTPLGSCNHGFVELPPLSLFDGKPHAIHAYGINSNAAGTNAELGGSPKTMTCAALPLTGVRRWVKDPTTYAAWKFSAFEDQMPVTDAALAKVPDGAPLDAAPALIKADNGAAVYWVDGTTKRHVPDPDVAAAWHLDLSKTQVMPAAKVAAMPEGAPLGTRPVLLKGTGAAVYLLDVAPTPPGSDGGASSGGTSGASSGGASSGGTSGASSGGTSSGDADGGPSNGDAPGDSGGGCNASAGQSSVTLDDALALLLVSPIGLAIFRARRRRARPKS